MLDQRWTTGLQETLLPEELKFDGGLQTCFFAAVHPMNIPVLTPRVEANQPRKRPYRFLKSQDRTTQSVGWM